MVPCFLTFFLLLFYFFLKVFFTENVLKIMFAKLLKECHLGMETQELKLIKKYLKKNNFDLFLFFNFRIFSI